MFFRFFRSIFQLERIPINSLDSPSAQIKLIDSIDDYIFILIISISLICLNKASHSSHLNFVS